MIVDVWQRRGGTILEVVSSFRCLGKPLSVTFAWIDNTSCLVLTGATGAQSWPASTGVESFPGTGITGWNRRRELRGWWWLHTPRSEGPRSSHHHRGRKRATNIAKGTSHSSTPTLCPWWEDLEPHICPLQNQCPVQAIPPNFALQILPWNNEWVQFYSSFKLHNCVCASNVWERPFPQLSLWALASKVWQLIWPHVPGEIMGGKCKEDQSETGREKEHEKQQIYGVTHIIYSAFDFICFLFFLFFYRLIKCNQRK